MTGEGADPAEAPKDGAAPASTSARIVERDVEAPEVFSANDEGLWDGRPSLGGVWVAHPTVKDPERVIIRNPANGKFVIGALFRRERENPGPKLQVSSDAAAALDMLAGAPTKLSVVALRREEQPDPAAAAPRQGRPAPGRGYRRNAAGQPARQTGHAAETGGRPRRRHTGGQAPRPRLPPRPGPPSPPRARRRNRPPPPRRNPPRRARASCRSASSRRRRTPNAPPRN
ncbi:hypothetical protein [Rhodobacter capsulatus]|uniref:hypothetical protein n=1 Tax=Rhodobacter capsulatus TaxID=1061 RepID=UPI004024AE97